MINHVSVATWGSDDSSESFLGLPLHPGLCTIIAPAGIVVNRQQIDWFSWTFQGILIPHIYPHFSWLTGWWLSPTPLKNDGVRQLGRLFPIYGKIKNVPNHQPA